MSGVSIPVLASSVFFTAFAAFGAGYLMSPPPVRTGDSRPIVDPEAWNRTAPTNPGFQAQATPAQLDVALQTAADDLNQRGWIDPEAVGDANYNDAVQTVEASEAYASGSYAVEPLDGAGGDEQRGTTTIMVLDQAEADRAWATSDNSPQPTNVTSISASR